jgi:hypothetical protein
MTRLIAFPLLLILGVRVLALLSPIFGEGWRRGVQRWTVALDVAGGAIMLALVGLMLWRGEPLAALLIALISIPVLIGMYRALPAWWRGD